MKITTILGDWGTTRLRLFRTAHDGGVERLTGPGIGQLESPPADTLLSTLAPWRDDGPIELFLCGMAGSRNGLLEVPYAQAPVDAKAWFQAASVTAVDGVRVTIAAGLSGTSFLNRPDVMRGEEAQLFGALALYPRLATGSHLVVLPGTHSKWTELVDGKIVRFHTFPTGEVFALLSNHSTLTRAGTDTEGREEGFSDGLARAQNGILASLFETRAAQLIEGRSHGWALGFLSGLLIGSEMAEAMSLLDKTPDSVTLIGDPGLAGIYAKAGAERGMIFNIIDGDACVIAGIGELAGELTEKSR